MLRIMNICWKYHATACHHMLLRLVCDMPRETMITEPTFSETIISHQYTECIRNTLESLKLNNVLRQSGKILLILLDIYIPCLCEFKLIISLNVTLCRWPPCHSTCSSSHNGIDVVIYCSISFRIPWIYPWIHYCK